VSPAPAADSKGHKDNTAGAVNYTIRIPKLHKVLQREPMFYKEGAMKLARDHKEVQELLDQLQSQYYSIDKVSSFVGVMNVQHLRKELYDRGWNSKLVEDGKTVVLFPVEQ